MALPPSPTASTIPSIASPPAVPTDSGAHLPRIMDLAPGWPTYCYRSGNQLIYLLPVMTPAAESATALHTSSTAGVAPYTIPTVNVAPYTTSTAGVSSYTTTSGVAPHTTFTSSPVPQHSTSTPISPTTSTVSLALRRNSPNFLSSVAPYMRLHPPASSEASDEPFGDTIALSAPSVEPTFGTSWPADWTEQGEDRDGGSLYGTWGLETGRGSWKAKEDLSGLEYNWTGAYPAQLQMPMPMQAQMQAPMQAQMQGPRIEQLAPAMGRSRSLQPRGTVGSFPGPNEGYLQPASTAPRPSVTATRAVSITRGVSSDDYAHYGRSSSWPPTSSKVQSVAPYVGASSRYHGGRHEPELGAATRVGSGGPDQPQQTVTSYVGEPSRYRSGLHAPDVDAATRVSAFDDAFFYQQEYDRSLEQSERPDTGAATGGYFPSDDFHQSHQSEGYPAPEDYHQSQPSDRYFASGDFHHSQQSDRYFVSGGFNQSQQSDPGAARGESRHFQQKDEDLAAGSPPLDLSSHPVPSQMTVHMPSSTRMQPPPSRKAIGRKTSDTLRGLPPP